MPNFELNQTLRQDCFEVAELPLCKILMLNDQQYPWFILVPKVASVTEIFQLSPQQQQQLMQESNQFGQWLMEHFQGDKLNVGAIGNVVSQLHIHHIVRFKNDACWPKPVWGQKQAIPFSEGEAGDRIGVVKEWVEGFK
jgi:diadenosine tetraphosphate (Ap4A) HIT family hydrolase